MKSFTLIALLGVAAANPGAFDSETMSALSQQGKNFENEVQDAEYDESFLQLDMNVNNRVIIAAQNRLASRDVPTSGLLMWDDMEKTRTELDLDDGEEDIKADVQYTDADLETVRLSASKVPAVNNQILVEAEEKIKERDEEESDEGLTHMGITDY